MRLNKLTIYIYPQEQTLITKWLMKWTDDGGNAGIAFDDSTKIVQTHTTKGQCLKWKPINATLPTNKAAGLVTINLRDWIVIDDLYASNVYYVPGTILYTIANNNQLALNFRLTMHVSFCGSKIATSTKLLEIAEKIAERENKMPIFEETPPLP